MLQPIEFVFPAGACFKTYELKVAQHHPECNVPVTDPALDERLRRAAAEIFVGFEGEGYARLDFRMDEAGEIFFLDINFACSVFYQPGYEGSADYILKFDPLGPSASCATSSPTASRGIAAVKRCTSAAGMRSRGSAFTRSATFRRARSYSAVKNARSGSSPEVMSERHWPPSQVEVFRRYALPTGGEVHILWDEDPNQWSPQNHSCDPNTAYRGPEFARGARYSRRRRAHVRLRRLLRRNDGDVPVPMRLDQLPWRDHFAISLKRYNRRRWRARVHEGIRR